MTTGVDHLTLGVHHVVILECVLTNTEVVLLNAFLCILDTLGYHRRLNHLAVVQTEAVEQLHYAFASEEAHYLVLKRHEEY